MIGAPTERLIHCQDGFHCSPRRAPYHTRPGSDRLSAALTARPFPLGRLIEKRFGRGICFTGDESPIKGSLVSLGTAPNRLRFGTHPIPVITEHRLDLCSVDTNRSEQSEPAEGLLNRIFPVDHRLGDTRKSACGVGVPRLFCFNAGFSGSPTGVIQEARRARSSGVHKPASMIPFLLILRGILTVSSRD
jgi:hypothetical protein